MTDDTISFDRKIANALGINEAIIIKIIWGWVKHNAQNGTNFHEGRYWTYNSARAYASDLTFMSERTISNTISKLIEKNILVKSNFNKTKFDKTSWYAFSDKGLEFMQSLGYQLDETQPLANFSNPSAKDSNPQENDANQYQLFNQENNQRKEKLYKKEEDSDFFAALIGIGVTEQTAHEWMDVRKRLKAINSQAAFDRVKRSVQALSASHNFTPEDAIRIAVEKGWKGVDSQYFDRIPPKPRTIAQTPTKNISPYEKIDEQGNRYYLQGSGQYKIIIPTDAPPRPNPMVFWSNYTNKWVQPQ